MREPAARTIVRIVLIIVAVAVCLYLIYQVRRPLTWLFISAFLAIALSGPVNRLTQHMRRGIAITIVYVGLLLVPIALIALIVPPFITEGNRFAENLPQYSREVTDFVERQRAAARAERGLRHHRRSSRRRPTSCPRGSAAPPRRSATWASRSSTRCSRSSRSWCSPRSCSAAGGSGSTRRCGCDHPSNASAWSAHSTGSPAPWAATWRARCSSPSSPACPPTSCSRSSACPSARRWR